MHLALSALCFLAATIAFFVATLMGRTKLAAFQIPAIINEWSLDEKQQACMNASGAYFVLGILFILWSRYQGEKSAAVDVGRPRLTTVEDFYRNCGMGPSDVAERADGWAYGLLYHENIVSNREATRSSSESHSQRRDDVERVPLLPTSRSGRSSSTKFLEETDSEDLEMENLN